LYRYAAGRAVGHPGTRLHGVLKVAPTNSSAVDASAAASSTSSSAGGEGGDGRRRRNRRRVSVIFFYGDEDQAAPSRRAVDTSRVMPREDMLAWFTSLASLARTAYRLEDREQEAQLDHWVRVTFLEIAQVLKHAANSTSSSSAAAAAAGTAGAGTAAAAAAAAAGAAGVGAAGDGQVREEEVAGGDAKQQHAARSSSSRGASHAADPAMALEGLRALASAIRFRGDRLTPVGPPLEGISVVTMLTLSTRLLSQEVFSQSQRFQFGFNSQKCEVLQPFQRSRCCSSIILPYYALAPSPTATQVRLGTEAATAWLQRAAEEGVLRGNTMSKQSEEEEEEDLSSHFSSITSAACLLLSTLSSSDSEHGGGGGGGGKEDALRVSLDARCAGVELGPGGGAVGRCKLNSVDP
jgi:hypothetical protein